MRCQVGLTPRPAVAVSLPRMAARLRPTVPLRTSSTITTATTSTDMERMNMAWPSKLKKALVPSHFALQARALGAARDPDVVEGGVVEEQRRGQRHQRQSQAAQAQRQERQDHGHDGGEGGADEAADQEVEAEVDGEARRP